MDVRGRVCLRDIEAVSLKDDGAQDLFVPVLPGGLKGQHDAKDFEEAVKSLVHKDRGLATELACLRNALANLDRLEAHSPAGLLSMAHQEKLASNRFVRDHCLERLAQRRPSGMSEDMVRRLWLVKANSRLYMCVARAGEEVLVRRHGDYWGITWETRVPISFSYTSGIAKLPAWSQGLWACVAASCDHLLVV